MQIPDRIKRFLKHTNSFAVIMENGKPEYIVASFDWAERILLGDNPDEETMEEVNRDFLLTAEEERPEPPPANQ